MKQELKLLGLDPAQLISASPPFQNQTKRKRAGQIDLLIDTRYAHYICQIKFRRSISATVIKEVDKKAKILDSDDSKSLRKVLIKMGKLTPGIENLVRLIL